MILSSCSPGKASFFHVVFVAGLGIQFGVLVVVWKCIGDLWLPLSSNVTLLTYHMDCSCGLQAVQMKMSLFGSVKE